MVRFQSQLVSTQQISGIELGLTVCIGDAMAAICQKCQNQMVVWLVSNANGTENLNCVENLKKYIMPSYELALVLRQMTRPELIATIKRSADAIYEKGGAIRKLESLGCRALPHKISAHGQVHREGNFFNIEFHTAPTKITELKEEYSRDIDIIRRNIFKVEEEEEFECTLHDELLPPAYRKEVQEMIKLAQKNQKPKYNYNSGLDYYPFQK